MRGSEEVGHRMRSRQAASPITMSSLVSLTVSSVSAELQASFLCCSYFVHHDVKQ
jgi:hypothetical protein